MNCPKCYKEMRVNTEQIGVDGNNIPIFHRFAYCDSCMIKQDLDASNNMNDSNGANYSVYNNTYSNTNNSPIVTKKKNSGLSVAAAICSLLIFTILIGVILAIIDLVKGKNDGKKHTGSYFALICFGIFAFVGLITNNKSENNSKETNNISVEQTNNIVEEETTNINKSVSNTSKKDPGIVTAASYNNMKLGEIGVKNDVYVGLSYVKRMTYLPTALGTETEISSGNEVILGFFDFYNNSDKKKDIVPSDITCYVDGTQVFGADNVMMVECDGINQYYSEDIEGYTQLISVQDFEVPLGWNEIKFFYKSDCVWIISQDDVSSDNFIFNSMYSNLDTDRIVTPEGSSIYNDKYEIVFQGVTNYTKENMFIGDTNYIVFKFTINNTGTNAMNYSLAGFNMDAYQNNYFLGDADYILDAKIDNYTNVFTVESIEPGMSSNVYVAFKSFIDEGDLFMIYDDGYITKGYKGFVYVKK